MIGVDRLALRPGISVADINEADIVWDVEYTDEFGEWFEQLGGEDQEAVVARVTLLEARGASLGRPAADNVHRSRHPNMKELRAERSLRVLFAFDPHRTAILLIGGHKSASDPDTPSWNRWYEHVVPIADDLYDEYLEELRTEGLI
jgi:hypothetical protein